MWLSPYMYRYIIPNLKIKHMYREKVQRAKVNVDPVI